MTDMLSVCARSAPLALRAPLTTVLPFGRRPAAGHIEALLADLQPGPAVARRRSACSLGDDFMSCRQDADADDAGPAAETAVALCALTCVPHSTCHRLGLCAPAGGLPPDEPAGLWAYKPPLNHLPEPPPSADILSLLAAKTSMIRALAKSIYRFNSSVADAPPAEPATATLSAESMSTFVIVTPAARARRWRPEVPQPETAAEEPPAGAGAGAAVDAPADAAPVAAGAEPAPEPAPEPVPDVSLPSESLPLLRISHESWQRRRRWQSDAPPSSSLALMVALLCFVAMRL
ncbi:uncharacterized protein V1510DRAFT_440915 [Dipodascopsis tothii]|uniref:uncharacterized protein n=1 Tax=Dipodascopsis tothii TaxID=44089 RepID=UPI0034CD5878